MHPPLRKVQLDESSSILSGSLDAELIPDPAAFEILWDLHPDEFHDVTILGKPVKTPRWQQAYNKTYQYTGSENRALPVPPELEPFWKWACENIDHRLNGLLLNWYDGKLGHYIGKHRDSITNLIPGSPIVTISFGEERKFRFRPYQEKGFQGFLADNGSVFVIPFETNDKWTHEVPASKKLKGRRISLTLRAFE